jgi:hypothetical protein
MCCGLGGPPVVPPSSGGVPGGVTVGSPGEAPSIKASVSPPLEINAMAAATPKMAASANHFQGLIFPFTANGTLPTDGFLYGIISIF